MSIIGKITFINERAAKATETRRQHFRTVQARDAAETIATFFDADRRNMDAAAYGFSAVLHIGTMMRVYEKEIAPYEK